jgi:hypothetical protein
MLRKASQSTTTREVHCQHLQHPRIFAPNKLVPTHLGTVVFHPRINIKYDQNWRI